MNLQTRQMIVGLVMLYIFLELVEYNLDVFLASQATNWFALASMTLSMYFTFIGVRLVYKSLKPGDGGKPNTNEHE